MLFYKRVPAKTMLAGSNDTLQLRVMALVAWLAATVLFAVLAIYAHSTAWDAGEQTFLGLATTVGGFGIGRLTGERSAHSG